MVLFPVIYTLVVLVLSTCNGQFHYDDVMKFESYNFPTYRMGYQSAVGQAGEREAYLSEDGKRFLLRPGLNGVEDKISFESADYRGHYLRYYNGALDLERREGARDAENYDTDASFQGRSNHWYAGYMAFESQRMPGHFIRHQGWRLRVDADDSSSELFRMDASWRMSKGPFVLQSRSQYDCAAPCKLAMGINSEAVMSETGTQLYAISPGLDGKHGQSVSFHHAKQPDLFLRGYGPTVFFENSSNVYRSPETFKQDASFVVGWNTFVDDYFSISEVIGGRYMCRSRFEVQLKYDDSTLYFEDDASFRTLEGPVLLADPSGDLQVAVNGDQHGVMDSEGTRFNLLYPGLTLTPGTASLESYERPGWFLRHYSNDMDLEDMENGRNPDIFKADASFFVERGVFGENTISLRSENFDTRYVVHEDKRLKIKEYEDTAEFRAAAAFKPIEASTEIVPTSPPTSPNTTAIIAASCTIGIILLLIVIAVFVDKTLNRRNAAKATAERPAEGIENPTYDTKGDGTPGDDPLYAEVGGAQRKKDDRVVIEPLPSVSELVKDSASTPPPPRPRSFGSKLRRSLSGTSDEDSIPIRNAIQTKLRRLSNSFSKADRSQNRRADIPTNFEIDFNKPFDFESDGGAPVAPPEGDLGFGNPLYGQQPSRVSLTFDELPSPMDFGLDGFQAGGKSSSETTPSNDKAASFFEDSGDEENASFPPIKKKAQSDSSEAPEAFTGGSFFDLEPDTPSFPAIRRKSTDKTGKRVSFSDTALSSPDDENDPPIYAAVDFSKKKKKNIDDEADA